MTTVLTAGMSKDQQIEALIENVRAAGGMPGDKAAKDELEKYMASQKGAVATAVRSATGAGAEPEGLVCEEKIIARPNGEGYHVRKIGIHHDIAALRMAREKNLNVLAFGPPGTGKTAMIEAAYAVDGQRVWTVQGSGDTEVGDFVGGFVQLPGGEFQWVDGPLLRAMENGEVLYIDEIALIDPKVMAVIYGVMDGRGEYRVTQNPDRGMVTAVEGFYIASACNPDAPGARMSEALLSRFTFQFEVGTDYDLAGKLGVGTKIVKAAKNLATKMKEGGSISWAPQLRELLAYRDMENTFGEDVALRNMVAGAPAIDRDQIAEVLGRSFGREVTILEVD